MRACIKNESLYVRGVIVGATLCAVDLSSRNDFSVPRALFPTLLMVLGTCVTTLPLCREHEGIEIPLPDSPDYSPTSPALWRGEWGEMQEVCAGVCLRVSLCG